MVAQNKIYPETHMKELSVGMNVVYAFKRGQLYGGQ